MMYTLSEIEGDVNITKLSPAILSNSLILCTQEENICVTSKHKWYIIHYF